MPVITLRPTVQVGNQGDAVEELQILLNQRLGNQLIFRSLVPLGADGDFGDRTNAAVLAYQEHYVTDTANFRNPHYHQPTDTLDTIDREFFLGSAQVIINAVTALLQGSD